MSFILDALSRSQVLRGRKTTALAHVAAAAPARAWMRRHNLWQMGSLVAAALCVVALGLAFLGARNTPRSAPPPPQAAASRPPVQEASVSVSSMASHPKHKPPPAPVAKFSPPTSLAQPLPTPSPVVKGTFSPALAATAPPRVVVDEPKPLTHLPGDLQAMVKGMKVRVYMVAPQRRLRFVMVEDRQLREGDELFAGLRLDEITEAGLVLRHNGTRVLAPAPGGR